MTTFSTNAAIATRLTQVGTPDNTLGTTPAENLGEKRPFNDGVYQYLKASGTVAQYALCKIANDFTIAEGTTTLLPSTEPAKVGIPQVALTVGQYAWVFVGPGKNVSVKAAASCVQDVKLYTTATAGVVDDAATTLINGLKIVTTIVGAAATPCIAECELGTVLA